MLSSFTPHCNQAPKVRERQKAMSTILNVEQVFFIKSLSNLFTKRSILALSFFGAIWGHNIPPTKPTNNKVAKKVGQALTFPS